MTRERAFNIVGTVGFAVLALQCGLLAFLFPAPLLVAGCVAFSIAAAVGASLVVRPVARR